MGFGGRLLYSLAFLSMASFQSSQSPYPQVLDPGSNPPTYIGSAVLVDTPLPTLVYNCALMPAICQNVQNWLASHGTNLPLNFHMDIQAGGKRTAARRSDSCPSTWSSTHPCPESIFQPLEVHGFNTGTSPSTLQVFSNALLASPVFNNEIGGLTAGDSSGLAYTCDEFPPASWIEGGSNGNGNFAETFCAPQGVSCFSTIWNQVKSNYKNLGLKYPLVRSEQNWQAASHALLRSYIKGKKNYDVGRFVFSTISVPPAGATPNAAIVYLGAATKTVTKRGLEHVETSLPDLPGREMKGNKTRDWSGVQIALLPPEQTQAPEMPV